MGVMKQRDKTERKAEQVERDMRAIWAAQREELEELRAKVASFEGHVSTQERRDAVLREMRPLCEPTLEDMVAVLQRGDAHMLQALEDSLAAILSSAAFPDWCAL